MQSPIWVKLSWSGAVVKIIYPSIKLWPIMPRKASKEASNVIKIEEGARLKQEKRRHSRRAQRARQARGAS
jgi:hypothetical protein